MKISEDENTITIDEIFDGRVVSFDYRAVKETSESDCDKCSFNQEPNDIYCPEAPCRSSRRKDRTPVYFEIAFFKKEDEK